MSRFTVLIPVHNEADNIEPLHAELARELGHLAPEVIVINDGSTDATGAELARHAPEWTVLDTPRLGKSRALELGLARVTTDRVVMMDGDLQDDTTAIPALLADLDEGADCAVGCRAGRKDGWLIKRFPSFFFNLYLSLLFGFRFLDINTGLKAFRTDTLRRITWFENCHRFFPLLVFRAGGRVTHRPTHHRPRRAGLAKFNSPLRFIGGFIQGLLLWAGWHDPMPRPARLARLLPIGAALLCGWFFFHWAAQDWPFADYDSAAFVPHMVRYAADGELINTFQPSAREWDPLGIGRQVGHGFLPSIVTGALAPVATYQSVHYVLAAQILVGLLFFARLLGRFAPVRPPHAWLTTSLQTLIVASAAYILFTREGRPEVFVFVVASVGLWFFLSLDTLGRLVTAGLVLSILAVSHPIAAILAGLAFLAWLAAALPGRTSWQAWAIAGLVTASGLATCFALYPYDIREWITGHLTHADAAIVNFPGAPLSPWFLNPAKGLGGLLFALAAIVLIGLLVHRRKRLAHPVALCLLAAAFLGMVWYFGLRLGFTVYNIEWLTPFGLALVLSLWWRLPASRFRIFSAVGFAVLMIPGSLAFTAEQFIRSERLRSGPASSEIRALIATLLPPGAPGPALVSGHYYHLVGLDPRFTRVGKYFTGEKTPGAAFMLVSQADIRRPAPVVREGWQVIHHTYDPRPVTVAGIPLKGLARGFHYALYLPEGTEPSPALSAFLSQLQTTGSDNAASNQ